MKNLPKARTENLVEQNLGAETLIYDLTTHQAFNLNETLSVVYKSCDGNTSFDDLKRKYKFTDDFIFLALDELKQNNLLAGEYVSPFELINRRDVIRKVGVASIAALPLIVGLSAPSAVQAGSGGLSCSYNVCYPAGTSLCDACYTGLGSVEATAYETSDGSCGGEASLLFENCEQSRNTPVDTKFSGVL